MAFKPSARKPKRRQQEEAGLSLTSMMDMMTIILLFLIQQFNTEGNLATQSEDLTLPEALATSKANQALNIAITHDHILVDNRVVATVAEVQAAKGYDVPQLHAVLDNRATRLMKLNEKLFTGEVLIQGDKTTPYSVLTKVIYTAGASGYNKIRLLTVKKGE